MEALRDAESAKLNALLDLLEPLMEEGHKVLVFSQFVTMLDLLRDTVQTASVAPFLPRRQHGESRRTGSGISIRQGRRCAF